MKYRLKDICSITKGATGIMKADGGKYPLVALSDERRNHSEFQFDAKAVIVPLISSTGHGHASMKRVHYQEGKFALGNILCAVIPKDETRLHPKYLHLYLKQFKDSLLVPLMKGAANVSLPMNKLADVEIEVPCYERQLEIIALEEEASVLKNELEERLIAQDGDVAKLRKVLLREAMQGKLTNQNPKDGNAIDLLKKIKSEKERLIAKKILRKEKELPLINEEEIPFTIPENWVWCRLGDIVRISSGDGLTSEQMDKNGTIPVYGGNGINGYHNKFNLEKETIVIGRVGYYCGCVHLTKNNAWVTDNAFTVSYSEENIYREFLIHLLRWADLGKQQFAGSQPVISGHRVYPKLIPLPPLSEQHRIVKTFEQLMQLCDELQYSIQQNKIENEKLLQGALRDALKKEEIITIEN